MSTLELRPAMPTRVRADWPGARWIGAVDVAALLDVDAIRLHNPHGYVRARLLVRAGTAVRGFVDVAIQNDHVDPESLRAQLATLPPGEAARVDPGSSVLPSITVVICTRDRPELLRDALGAVLALDYPDFRVVIVDNASATSETRDLVGAEFQDARVTLLDEPVAGLARARNTGLLAATGEIVAFTDDDVVVDGAWLREIAAGFQRAPHVDCVNGLVPSGELRTRIQGYFDDRVSWSKNLVPAVFHVDDPPAALPLFPFSLGQFGTGANFAVRRTEAIELGGFDVAFGVGTPTAGGEDIDFFTRVLIAGGTLVLQPSAIVWHRHRDDLAALRIQARGYGTGLGAWMTKILLHPRTARMVLSRSGRALRRLASLGASEPAGRDIHARKTEGDAFTRELARVRWLELFSVARGPLLYAKSRAAARVSVPRSTSSAGERA